MNVVIVASLNGGTPRAVLVSGNYHAAIARIDHIQRFR
jgi:hypothetical protein